MGPSKTEKCRKLQKKKRKHRTSYFIAIKYLTKKLTNLKVFTYIGFNVVFVQKKNERK